MATRFYFPSTGTADVVPAFGSWTSSLEDATQPSRPLVSAKSNTALAETAHAEAVTTNPAKNPIVQYVSAPLAAQTISGNVSGVLLGREASTSANASLALVMHVVSGDGLTERGELYAPASGFINTTSVADVWGSEFGTSNSTRTVPVTALNPVTAQDGDRLVIELGSRNENSVATSWASTLQLGDPTATADYARTPGLTTPGVGWIEFDATISFATGGASIAGTVAAVSGTSGTLAVSAISGTAAAVSTAAGTVAPSTIAGMSPAVTTTAGTLPLSTVAGTVAAISASAGTVARSAVSGAAAAVTTTTGTLTPATTGLAGTVAAVTSSAGTVARSQSSGTVAAVSAGVGTLARSLLSGVSAATTTAQGTLSRSSLAGIVAASAQTVGTVARSLLSGIVDAISATIGTLAPDESIVAPPSRTRIVPASDRTRVMAAAGPRVVGPSDRTRVVPLSDRTRTVPPSDRTITIPGGAS